MPKSQREIREERKALKQKYGELYDSVAALLFRHDPISINFENNTDEYETEAGTILPRLSSCNSVDDAGRVIYEEFVRWFDRGTAGPEELYDEIAKEIWRLWMNFRQRKPQASSSTPT
jgi:hypothetical protein